MRWIGDNRSIYKPNEQLESEMTIYHLIPRTKQPLHEHFILMKHIAYSEGQNRRVKIIIQLRFKSSHSLFLGVYFFYWKPTQFLLGRSHFFLEWQQYKTKKHEYEFIPDSHWRHNHPLGQLRSMTMCTLSSSTLAFSWQPLIHSQIPQRLPVNNNCSSQCTCPSNNSEFFRRKCTFLQCTFIYIII